MKTLLHNDNSPKKFDTNKPISPPRNLQSKSFYPNQDIQLARIDSLAGQGLNDEMNKTSNLEKSNEKKDDKEES